MENEKNEQVIFVKDLLFVALYQWRRILVAALIFAIVLGAFSLFSEIREASNEPSMGLAEKANEEYEREKALLTDQLETAEKLYASQLEYCEESVYMELDPYQLFQTTIDLTVPADPAILYPAAMVPMDNIGAILYAYRVYLSSEAVIASVAQQMDLEAKYLWELIRFSSSDATRSLSMGILYPTQEGAQKLLDIFMKEFQQAQQQVAQTVGAHNSNIVVGSINERIDQSLISMQSAAKTRLQDLDKQVSTLQDSLEALQEPATSSVSKKKVIIIAVIGAILGACLVAGIAWLAYISGGKVYSARTLRNATGLKVLGCLAGKEYPNQIDRLLRKLEGRSMDTQRLDVIAATVRNCCPGEKLLITGNAPQQEALAQQLQKLGLQPCVCGNLPDSTQALEALPSCDAVLLVESCGVSRYADILQTMERVADQNKPVIGCVLLEG